MNSENIFEGISYIDSRFIDNSAAVLKRRRFMGLTKVAASVAAALALVFGGFTVLYNAVLADKTSDNNVPPVVVAEIDGAGYCQEGFHTGDFRKPHGLHKPSDEVKGEFIGSYPADHDDALYAFYEIKGSINREILLGERKGELSYWARVYGGESFETVGERLEHYGYGAVEDVHTMRVDGKIVKNGDKISEVWNALLNGTEITFEEYERLLQGEDYDDANVQEVYSRHADSHLTIEFNYGELTYIGFGYYTDIGCFDGLGYILPTSPIAF